MNACTGGIQATADPRPDERRNVYLNFEYRAAGRGRPPRSGKGVTINMGRRGALLLMPTADFRRGEMLELHIRLDALYASALQGEREAPFPGGPVIRRDMQGMVAGIVPLDEGGFSGGGYAGVEVLFYDEYTTRGAACRGRKETEAMDRILCMGSFT